MNIFNSAGFFVVVFCWLGIKYLSDLVIKDLSESVAPPSRSAVCRPQPSLATVASALRASMFCVIFNEHKTDRFMYITCLY